MLIFYKYNQKNYFNKKIVSTLLIISFQKIFGQELLNLN